MNLKTEVTRKQSMPSFPKNEHLLPPDTHTVCVSWGKKRSFFGKIWHALISCYLRFEIYLFALLLAKYLYLRKSALSISFFYRSRLILSWAIFKFISLIWSSRGEQLVQNNFDFILSIYYIHWNIVGGVV